MSKSYYLKKFWTEKDNENIFFNLYNLTENNKISLFSYNFSYKFQEECLKLRENVISSLIKFNIDLNNIKCELIKILMDYSRYKKEYLTIFEVVYNFTSEINKELVEYSFYPSDAECAETLKEISNIIGNRIIKYQSDSQIDTYYIIPHMKKVFLILNTSCKEYDIRKNIPLILVKYIYFLREMIMDMDFTYSKEEYLSSIKDVLCLVIDYFSEEIVSPKEDTISSMKLICEDITDIEIKKELLNFYNLFENFSKSFEDINEDSTSFRIFSEINGVINRITDKSHIQEEIKILLLKLISSGTEYLKSKN